MFHEVTLKEKKGKTEILEYRSVPLLNNSIFTLSPLATVIYLTGNQVKKFSPLLIRGLGERREESEESYD